jgi:flagellar protein FliO/FliZ
VKHKLIGTLLFILIASYCSVSAEPVATVSSGFLTEETPVATSSAASETALSVTPASATADAPLPFYMEGPVASAPFLPMPDPMGSTLRIISSLFAIIIIAFGLSWLIQKKAGFGGNVFGKVLGILPLDNRRMIYLVDVMGKVLILGVTDSSINMLAEITDKDTLDALRLQNDKPLPGMERLFSFLRPGSAAESDSPPQPASEDQTKTPGQAQNQRNHERLSRLNELLVKRKTPPEN